MHRTFVLGVLLVLMLAACSRNDGRTLQPPEPGATAPPRTVGADPTVGTGMTVTSPAFAVGEPIPFKYSCRSDHVSPPLAWTNVPAGTAELAVVVIDVDAGDFLHWAIWGIHPGEVGLTEGAPPPNAAQARNGRGDVGWLGPCPDKIEPHRYVFTLYALGSALPLATGADGKEAVSAIEAASIARAELMGTFTSL